MRKIPSGLILDHPATLEQLPDFELLFGAAGEKMSWKEHMPVFRNQGSSYWCTAFAMCNIGSSFNKLETKQDKIFSPYELFYRSGGSEYGNTLVAAAGASQRGYCLEQDKPTPVVNTWGAVANNRYRVGASVDSALIRGEFALKSSAFVSPTKENLKAALAISPVMLAIGIGRDYWAKVVPRQSKYSAYHAVVLTDILDDGTYEIFDSLAGTPNFDGFHLLASDYEILYALSFVDLPNGWTSSQSKAKTQTFEHVLNHYAKTRNLSAEIAVAEQFRNLLKSHPTLQAGAAKLWTVLVNALAYGSYSMTDLLNHLTSLRRSNKPIFDLNSERA